MRFVGFVARRLVGIAAVMIGVSVITFAISHLVPADPAIAALGDHASAEQIAAFRSEYHLDRPLPEQYLTYVGGILRGDLGRSIRTRREVVADLAEAFPATLELLLPALTLGYFSTAVIARMTRSSMLEVLGQDYMRIARAKGLQERIVVLRHGLRNALIPTVTIIGLTFGSLLSGAVLTETIFSWPGLGRYATAAAVALDFPAVLGVTLLAAIVYPLANLAVDIAYFWLDPRTQRG